MRVKHALSALISDDTAGKQKLYESDETLSEQKLDGFDHCSCGIMTLAEKIAGPEVTEDVGFGDVADGQGFILVADHDFDMRLNGGSETLHAKRAGDTATVFLEVGISQITLVNPSEDDKVRIRYAVWGDATA